MKEGDCFFWVRFTLTFLVCFFFLVSLLSRIWLLVCYMLFYCLAHLTTQSFISRCAPYLPLVQSALHAASLRLAFHHIYLIPITSYILLKYLCYSIINLLFDIHQTFKLNPAFYHDSPRHRMNRLGYQDQKSK